MINVEWYDNQICENCGAMKPHCARIIFDFSVEQLPNAPDFTAVLCSDCVEDLKKRLS